MKAIKQTFIIISLISQIEASPIRFAWEALKRPDQVGALFECSVHVGRELMRYAKDHKGPKTLIEVGAGMGSITKVICKNYLKKEDRLDVIEINPEYCVQLRRLFPREQYPNVRIHCVDVLKFESDVTYDYIICTLPFNAFSNGMVKQLQDKMKAFGKKEAHLSYVEYIALSSLRISFTQDNYKYHELVEHKKIIEEFKNRHLLQTVKVYKNIPPIYIHHLQFT